MSVLEEILAAKRAELALLQESEARAAEAERHLAKLLNKGRTAPEPHPDEVAAETILR